MPLLKDLDKKNRFRALYDTYYAPFCIYAKRFIDDKEDCEDIVSEVFTSLWEHIDLFDPQSPTALAYIKMCVKNSCLNYLKHRDHIWKYEEQCKAHEDEFILDPDQIYTRDELYARLNAAIQKLPDSYREVFVQKFFEDKTYTEIAEHLGISVKSVNRYKQRSIELLRAELSEEFGALLLLLSLFN
jgi:RNA polymerase sigma-70 factor (ECF subfamily)